MKESIASVWTTGLVITFMLIFSGYLAVTISYSSTVKLKNGVLSIIEKRYGFTSKKAVDKASILHNGTKVDAAWGTFQSINLYLKGNAYKTKGFCAEGKGDYEGIVWYGVTNLYADDIMSVKAKKAEKGEKYYYCFAKVLTSINEATGKPATGANKDAAYWRFL